jgi:hypothetical protein
MHRARLLALLLPCLLAACRGGFEKRIGPEAGAVLSDPDALEILALEPRLEPLGGPLPPDADAFHGYLVLGRAGVSDPAERARIIALVGRGIEEADDRVAACFAPRHGLHATLEGRSLDLVICYECLRIRLFGAGGDGREVQTANGVEKELSEIFRAHGLAIAGR